MVCGISIERWGARRALFTLAYALHPVVHAPQFAGSGYVHKLVYRFLKRVRFFVQRTHFIATDKLVVVPAPILANSSGN